MKRIISIIVCTLLLCCLFAPVSLVSFAVSEKAVLKVGDVSGNPGDTVYVPVRIEKNPGFSNIAFSLSFNKSTLDYKSTIAGLLPDYCIFDHTKEGRIALAYTGDYSIEGDGALVCFEFKIKKKAELKTGKISLSKTYISGSDSESIAHSAKKGEIKVAAPCAGEHEYSGGELPIAPSCTTGGIKATYCANCGHCESEILGANGHTPQKEFTLDVLAKDGRLGMLSRHCSTCGAKTSIVTYTEENPIALSLNNSLSNLSDDNVSSFVMLFNGGKTYPEINYDVTDVESFVAQNANRDGEERKPAINDDKTVNVDVAVDRVLQSIFGGEKQPGILDVIKRAAIAGEIPIKIVCKLICLILL